MYQFSMRIASVRPELHCPKA